jgi:MoaA/NifB/PqqE/SkfB family radical SAM enzyme
MLKIITAKIILYKNFLMILYKTAANFGVRSALVYSFYFLKAHFLWKSKRFLQIGVHITEHCNLNCAYCSHFSPLADEIFLDTDSFERDCAQLAKISPKLANLGLLGGEPLLHPKLIDFFEIARRYFKTSVIQLITNGTLLSKQPDSFWITCHKYKICITISDYPLNIDIKTIREKCRKYRICIVYTLTSREKENRMSHMALDLNGGQDPETSYVSCAVGKSLACLCLRDGKIYPCPTVAYILFFNKYFNKDLKVSEKDYVDIYKITDKKSVFDSLGKPFPFCRYCNPSAMQDGLKWRVSKKDISEWT